MPDPAYVGLVVGMGCVTYLPRWIPLFFLAQRRLPSWLIEWLDMIPVSILSALIFPEIFTSGEPRQLDVFQVKSLVAVPTFLFAMKTRSLGGTVVLGMFLFWLLEKVF